MIGNILLRVCLFAISFTYQKVFDETFLCIPHPELLFLSTDFQSDAPSESENIDFLITFGPDATTEKGDDDFSQVFFILIPYKYRDVFYIRIWDPDVSGSYDDRKGDFDTQTKFALYSGADCFTHPDARSGQPTGAYDSGTLRDSKVFGSNKRFDNDWFTFGPINPNEGEDAPYYKGKVFKIIAEGINGDDGNAYKYFVSTKPNLNKAIEGAKLFTYEYTFRLKNDPGTVANLYPFVDDSTTFINQMNYDFDFEGAMHLVTSIKNGRHMATGSNGQWAESQHVIKQSERNNCINIQILKQGAGINYMTIQVKNQHNTNLPFFTIPLGHVPRYYYVIDVRTYDEVP